MYDANILRWLVPDPYRQHWSPYVAMGNNPVNLVDPNGGEDGNPEPWQVEGFDQLLADSYVLDAVTINGSRSLVDIMINVWDNLDVVTEVNGRIDIGLAAKVKASLYGLKTEIDVNVVSVNLFKAGGDFTDADSWGYERFGDGTGAEVTNSLGIGVYLPLKQGTTAKYGLGVYTEQHQTVHGTGAGGIFVSKGYGNSAGVNALVKVTHKSSGLLKDSGFSGKVGKNKDFYGLDLGVGAQFILGAEINLKVGFNY
jgi:hypothetical protein